MLRGIRSLPGGRDGCSFDVGEEGGLAYTDVSVALEESNGWIFEVIWE